MQPRPSTTCRPTGCGDRRTSWPRYVATSPPGPPDPAVALALRWLERTRPPTPGPVGVVHGDLRLGNLLVDVHGSQPRLGAVLDWELAHAGGVHADLGWFCSRTWRFGESLAAGGLGTRDDLLAAYAAAGGEPPDRDALRWWELLGGVRWAAMCRIMGGDAARRDPPPLEPAMVGRRAAEAAHDCLRLLPGGIESPAPVPGGAGVDEPVLPDAAPATSGSGGDLLAAAAADLDRRAGTPTHRGGGMPASPPTLCGPRLGSGGWRSATESATRTGWPSSVWPTTMPCARG